MHGECWVDTAFRSATPADVEWLIELRRQTMTAHLEAAGERLSLDEHRARVIHDFDCVQIVTSATNRIGMVKVVKAPDQWRLVQIQLAPARQNKGIGGRIVGELLRDARRRGIPVVLSVLKGNPAKNLYERLGFEVVAETEASYEMRADG